LTPGQNVRQAPTFEWRKNSAESEAVVNEQVHAVVFAVHFRQCSLRVRADLHEDVAQDVDRTCVEHTAAIL
jgi:hypothetical protein